MLTQYQQRHLVALQTRASLLGNPLAAPLCAAIAQASPEMEDIIKQCRNLLTHKSKTLSDTEPATPRVIQEFLVYGADFVTNMDKLISSGRGMEKVPSRASSVSLKTEQAG